MPLDYKIKKVLVIGSGPIIIGQAAEFDYAGTQACRALKKEGIEVVLVNSNPATIMTDTDIADRIYIEPLKFDILKRIIEKEKPDSILPNLGGQVGLNLAMELAESGFLEDSGVRLLGTNMDTIKAAEDRQTFKDTMKKINQPVISSKVVENFEDALEFASHIGFPVVVRPAYTLGGTGGGIAYNEDELFEISSHGLRLSRVNQILIEKCVSGWKEIEYEVIRDKNDNCIVVCNMENIDPVGVHTGDSIVVAPCQTLSAKESNILKKSSFDIIKALNVQGGCNVQYALNPLNDEYAVIEVNPRVSRSSALASKATGYPIATITTKIALGYTLDEIENKVTGNTYSSFEPAIDYVVIKVPRWPFDKFTNAKRMLGTQMKATGEVMAIASGFEAAFMKAIRSCEIGVDDLGSKHEDNILKQLENVDDERIFVVASAIRQGVPLEKINEITKIDLFFLGKIKSIIDMADILKNEGLSCENLKKAKQLGYTDNNISKYTGIQDVKSLRVKYNILPKYKQVDTCSGEFEATSPYYYSTYDSECEVTVTDNKKLIVFGSGPIRIGQGIEFDYCSVHAVWALKEKGYETIIINNNPETVSTDFDIADKLYFEPLTPEDVENIIELEKPDAAVVQFGGQTALKLTKLLKKIGLSVLGTSIDNIDCAEDRKKFDEILEECNIPRPKGFTVFSKEEAVEASKKLGFPVLVRPSYVLGGQGMEIAYCREDVEEFMDIINMVKQEHPVLVDKYIKGKEIEVDAVCDGEDILIPGIMEHLEKAGVHSGDSISVYPSLNIETKYKEKVVKYTHELAKKLNVLGLINIQFILFEDEIYVIEVNPRSSRTVPYISKVTGIPMIKLAIEVSTGSKLKDLGYGTGLFKEIDYFAIKVPVFSFEKLHDVDISLGPEMKSTGETLGISSDFEEALYKGFLGAGIKIPDGGGILITVRDRDKEDVVPIAYGFAKLGFDIYATGRTAHVLNSNYVATNVVKKIGCGAPDIIDLIQQGKINLCINTPTKGRGQGRDGFQIRRKAVEYSLPCLTSLDTARVLLACIKAKKTQQDVEIIDISKL